MSPQAFTVSDTVGGTCSASGYCFSVNDRCFGLFQGFGPGWTVADLVTGTVICSGFDDAKDGILHIIRSLIRSHFNGWKPTVQNMNPYAKPNTGLKYWITTTNEKEA